MQPMESAGMNEDTTIVKQVLNGDTEAFRLLVERYNRPVISMVRNIINDHSAAEDVAQEVFIAAFKKLNTFDSHRSLFSTWLFTIARNKSITAIRKRQSRERVESQHQVSQQDGGDDTEDMFEELNRILERIPRKQKAAFVMAHFEDVPYERIAQIEGVSIGTIKSRINRAKKKLAVAMKNKYGVKK